MKVALQSELYKLSRRPMFSKCQLKLVATENGVEYENYLQELSTESRGGTPSVALDDFIFQTFSII